MEIKKLVDSLPEFYSLADRELILRAYKMAADAHDGQSRASGEPYVNHCVAVASILAELRVPPVVIAAGLLHDTVEDTEITIRTIRREFGKEIAKLVDGVTKLTQLPRVSRGDQIIRATPKRGEKHKKNGKNGDEFSDDEVDGITRSRRYDLVSETLRKTFLAMGDDVRVVLIKLADRLHNMRTLRHVPEQKRKRIAQQTLDIFAPLASRLGIWQIKWELEDLSFRHGNPEMYAEIADNLAERRSDREHQMEEITNKLEEVLSDAAVDAEISGRPKHIYSIYRKMMRKDVPFDLVHDVRAVRIIVPDEPTCYSALGVIHKNWRPIPGEFDDYIAAPKDNFYQSLHTAVVYDDGKTLEVQIRTNEMHQNAEYGIAAHWIYKEGPLRDEDYERRVSYLRQLMEWQQDVLDASEFLDSMKSDVFGDRVFTFTPRGDIIDLPAGATAIDFAYHVHTEIGHRCRGAKVNGRLVSLDYELVTGDQVEILTAKRGGPSRDWLNPSLGLVKTQRARAKIRRWFKRQARAQNITQGKSILERELRRLGVAEVNIENLAREFGYRKVEGLHEALGCGDLPVGRIVNHFTLDHKVDTDELLVVEKKVDIAPEPGDAIAVLGLKGLLTVMAKCCNPAPGDEIVGYITRGRGATIHRHDCPNVLRVRDRERLVQVSWGEPMSTYPIPVQMKAYDRDGLMRDVSTLIADAGINMSRVQVEVDQNLAIFNLVLEVRDISELSLVLTRLENLPNVIEARRVRPG